ncbi:MAG: hypothetical protein ACODAD_11950 [Planctomycetota bacterium]
MESCPRQAAPPVGRPRGGERHPGTLRIPITINGQACAKSGGCELISNESMQAEFAGTYESKAWSESFEGPRDHVTITGHVEPKVVAPGETMELVLTANLQPPWHIYRYALTDPKTISKPTLIALGEVHGWTYEAATASSRPKEEKTGIEQEPVVYYHAGTVSWTTPIHVPEHAEAGEYEITGGIAFQTCTPTSRDAPSAADFKVRVAVGTPASGGRTQGPVTFASSTYAQVARDAERANLGGKGGGVEDIEEAGAKAEQSFNRVSGSKGMDWSIPGVLLLAFFSGLILNVTRSVLPVIGLRIRSFVHQSGGTHREIPPLNPWFVLGLMSIFWILGAGGALAGQAGASLLDNAGFLIMMIGIVFAFGLSFLGVWKIPVPGFAISGPVGVAAQREGGGGGVWQRGTVHAAGNPVCRPPDSPHGRLDR